MELENLLRSVLKSIHLVTLAFTFNCASTPENQVEDLHRIKNWRQAYDPESLADCEEKHNADVCVMSYWISRNKQFLKEYCGGKEFYSVITVGGKIVSAEEAKELRSKGFEIFEDRVLLEISDNGVSLSNKVVYNKAPEVYIFCSEADCNSSDICKSGISNFD